MSDSKLFQVPGQVAVITGAGSGLGRMMAHALAANGAHKVYILGRRLDKLQETASPYSNIIIPIQGDATSKDSLKSTADKIKSEVGYVNVLICNSGYVGPGMEGLPQNPTVSQIQEFFWSYDQKDFDKVFALNNTGSFFTMVAFLELLDVGNKKKNTPEISSQVVFTASIAGLTRMLSTGAAYIPSKAAVIQQTKLFSTFLGKYGIRVNAIAPGIYPSEMTQNMVGRAGFSVETIPVGRIGSEEDMRGSMLYLTSRAGAYANGLILLSDGGRVGQAPASY